ncbi:hypothetical protein H6B15_05750 [Gemmiger formicilis]|uniref:RICIN domain-containing protein n=1 Tax=Gemmiger formicilis TaxID=745368 RepID=UPI0019570187|nr:hypothetical protein [Gemmiger formicilis]MBM6716158.1 hypothetical protein [Gemmiger formicilis]
MAYENGGTYWICPVDNTGVALSVRGDSQVSQNRDVFLYKKEDIGDQLWRVDVGNGFARIKSTLDDRYALNIYLSTGNCDIHTWADNLEDSKINFRTIDASNNIYQIQNYRNNADNNLYLTASKAASGGLVTWNASNGSSLQKWKLIKKTGGGTGTAHEISMPVNINQKYIGNSTFVQATGCALCCGVDIASKLHNTTYSISDFRLGTDYTEYWKNGDPIASYNWTGPGGFDMTPTEDYRAISEADTIERIRAKVRSGIPIACHAVGSGGKEHWFVPYKLDGSTGSTWATCGIWVLDPYNGDKNSYNGRKVPIWTAMHDSGVTLGINRARIPK